jgi:hypothetical protein
MDLYVIRRPSAWANLAELEAAGAKSAKIGNEEMLDLVRHRTLSDILLCERACGP